MLRKVLSISFTLLLFGVLAVPSALAMQPLITFKTNQPVELPGRVLPAGSYSILNATPNASDPVLLVLNSHNKSVGFYQTEGVWAPKSPDKVVIKMQPERGSVARLKEFFTPNDNVGYVLQYPQQHSVG
jgi:hypothetical protein